MSSISNLTIGSSVPAYTLATNQVSGAPERNGDGDGPRVHHGHRGSHGGGGMGQELMAALQSLGLTPPASASTSSSRATGSDTGESSDQSPSSDGVSRSTLRKDMHEFMHQLFDAARQAESSGSTTSGGSAAERGKGSFAQGLSALLSEVCNGHTPSGLQDAFNKLKSDLNASGNGGDATLQALLSKLQGNLGYGAASAGSTTAGVGTTLSTVA
jgi:hypothetical protein